MTPLSILIKSLGGKIPTWKDLTDAGLDLHASEAMVMPPLSRVAVPLGIATAFGPQYVAIIKDRSGLAAKGIYTHGGVIDSSYRGEWKVLLENRSEDTFKINIGDRVAQVVFLPCFHLQVIPSDNLPDSLRGQKGFGSSGL